MRKLFLIIDRFVESIAKRQEKVSKVAKKGKYMHADPGYLITSWYNKLGQELFRIKTIPSISTFC